MFDPNDIKLILEASRRNPLLSKVEEQDLAEQIFTTRIALWEHALSYPLLCGRLLDFAKPKLFKLVERMKAKDDEEEDGLDFGTFETCTKAAYDIRRRDTRRHADAFAEATKLTAKMVAKIDSGLKVLSVAQGLMQQPKPLGGRNPPMNSGKFATYLQTLDEGMGAHRALKERFWLANIRLAVKMAKKYDYGLVPFADLIQEGLLGLMVAVERFDYRKGFKFSTYGTWWVRHGIGRFLANHGRTVRWPAHVVTDFDTLRRARSSVFNKGLTVTVEALAEESGLKPKRVETILGLSTINAVSIDAPLKGFDGEETLADRLADGKLDIPEASAQLDPAFRKIKSKIHRLPGIEGDILVKRFGLDGKGERTLREIAAEHALSRERIRQLQERGLDRLRGCVRA